jgi:hypothetical protein
MRHLIAPLALVIGLFAGTGSAAAAPPTPNDPSTIQYDCPGFKVDAQGTGMSKTIDRWLHPYAADRPEPFYTSTGAATTVTLTSVTAAPKTVTYSVNGTIRLSIQWEPFDFVYKATGRNLIEVPVNYGTPGLFLAVGQETWTLNGPVYPNAGMTGPGTITDVCQLLAP